MPNTFLLLGLLSVLAGIVVSGFLYFRQHKSYSKPVLYSLFALRALAFGLLFFVLIAPFISFKTKEISKPIVAVLVDNSASMLLGADSATIKTELYKTLQQNLGGLNGADAQFYSFDEDMKLVAPTFTGAATDLAGAIKKATAEIDRERLAAIVVVSDGIVNLGGNPFYEVENSFLPVFTIAVGDSTRQKDLAVADVRAPEFVFRGDEVLIEVTVSAENLPNFTGELALMLNNKKVSTRPVKVVGTAFAKVFTFAFPANQPGLFSYAVVLPKAADERNVSNNLRQFYIEVIENRKHIAVVATSPSPDVAALREALKKIDAYEVSFLSSSSAAPLTNKTELAVVFLQPFANATALKNVLKSYTGPLWIIIDPATDGQVVQNLFEFLSKVGRPQNISLKPVYNTNFGLFKLSKESVAALNQLPALNIFSGSMRANGSFEALLSDSQEKPVASYGTVGARKVVLFALSGLWDWRMADFKQFQTHAHVDEWLHVTAQFLTTEGNGNRLKVTYEKRLALGSAQKIRANVYDATFKETTEALVNVELKKDAGERLKYSLTNDGHAFEAIVNQLEPGKYTFVVTAKLGEETLKTQGAFYVESSSLEELNTRANYLLLAQMATTTGGKFYTLANANMLAEDINSHPMLKPVEKIKTQSVALIDLKELFFVMLVLFAAEWFLRRYFGKI